MAIVSSSYVVDHAQVDGRNTVVETHTDHLGAVYIFEYLADNAMNKDTILANRAAQLATDLAEGEAQALLG